MSDVTVHQAMTAVMRDLGAIGKNRKADPKMGGYAFRGIDDLYNALHDKLAAHGVFFVPEVLDVVESDYKTSGGATMRLVRLTVKYRFYGPDGNCIEATTVGEAADTADKAANKAMTAGLKYLLFQVFCIATEDNEDADAGTPDLGQRIAEPAKHVDLAPLEAAIINAQDAGVEKSPEEWQTLRDYARRSESNLQAAIERVSQATTEAGEAA